MPFYVFVSCCTRFLEHCLQQTVVDKARTGELCKMSASLRYYQK